MKTFEKIFLGWLLALLVAMTVGAIFSWEHTFYAAYTFFISWGVLFIYYMVGLRNMYSLLLAGFMAGAAGLYLTILHSPKAEATLLLGKLSLTVFTVLLGIRLYKMRTEIDKSMLLFIGLIGLLLLQLAVQNSNSEEALQVISLNGMANYFTIGVVANILLNDNYANVLKKGERKILLMQVVFCLYNISLMMIFNFS
jgi:hypothetical protein